MRAVEYSVIERAVALRLGWDPDELDATEFGAIRDAVSQSLEEIWRYGFWADLMRVERRRYRSAYAAATAYVSSDIVYHIGSDAYYIALKSTTGNAPATYASGTWTTNAAYWYAAAREYSGEDYSASTAYVAGDVVLYPETGLFYACHTSTPGNLPTDTTKWGVLTEFVPYVAWTQSGELPIGDVEGVYYSDPTRFRGAKPVTWDRTRNGVEPRDYPYPTQPWIHFRSRPHRFFGEAYDASAAYTVIDSEDSSTADSAASGGGSAVLEGYAGVASLRARTEHTSDQLAYLLYVSTEGDGGQGWFRFNATSTATDDGLNTIKPTDIDVANPGRWIRMS